MLNERSAVASLAAIMACRLLGLFMILPVFSLYVNKIPGATPWLIGIALGVYGLTQALLQIPFGMLSDRIGRKPVITVGLLLFAVGSLVAALSHGITGIIVGRALQGSGAIGSTVLATVADLTRDEARSRAMAIVGMTIGCSFAIAMIIGPAINAWFQLSGLFWASILLAGFSLILLHTVVPTPPKLLLHPDLEAESKRFRHILRDKELLRLDLGIGLLHAILTALFIAIPITLLHTIALSAHQQTWVYCAVLVLAFILSLPLIIAAEKKRKMKPVFISCIAILILCAILLRLLPVSALSLGLILLLFFTAFTLLEATLPSLISKISPIRNKGTAMGVYSSSQFFGIFVGGALGGWVLTHYQTNGIFVLCAVLGTIWLLVAIGMKQPPYFSTLIVSLDETTENVEVLQQQLSAKTGVHEVAVMPEEGLIYLKIDRQFIGDDELRNAIRAGNLA